MLSMFAVFALSAIGAGSAAANDKCHPTHEGVKDTEDINLCINNEEAGSPSEHLAVSFTSSKKAATESKLEVTNGPTIKCKTATNTGQFDKENGALTDNGKSVEISDLVITFKECKVTNSATTEANCVVTEPIEANGGPTKDGIDGILGSPTEVAFSPSEGTIFANIVIKNNGTKVCSVKTGAEGSNVTGKQKCTLPGSETEAVTHEVVCATSGSELKFGATENTAVFELTENVTLSGAELGKEFSLVKS
jgi:hypothetical protein